MTRLSSTPRADRRAAFLPLLRFVGATRSHLDLFKKHRAARIDHYVIEVNKLIIRLEKVRSRQKQMKTPLAPQISACE